MLKADFLPAALVRVHKQLINEVLIKAQVFRHGYRPMTKHTEFYGEI
jgi:hypothetical protein